jgi:hypothetical protein
MRKGLTFLRAEIHPILKTIRKARAKSVSFLEKT